VLVIGHRGAPRVAAENTPESFAAADAMGADGVELDVRLAATPRRGRRLVVHHDPLPVGAADAGWIDALPGFDDVLDACGDRMLVNVEIKNSSSEPGFDPTMAVVGPTIEAIRRRGRAWSERCLISSFSLDTIDHCRMIAPDIATAHLVTEADEAAIVEAARRGHVALHPREDEVGEAFVAAAHAAGLAVNVWTCNDHGRLRELASLGVDGVCTDVPDEAAAVLGRTRPTLSPRWGTRDGLRRARG
jgi:glycerophosphoryl diester phosphodiesterase